MKNKISGLLLDNFGNSKPCTIYTVCTCHSRPARPRKTRNIQAKLRASCSEPNVGRYQGHRWTCWGRLARVENGGCGWELRGWSQLLANCTESYASISLGISGQIETGHPSKHSNQLLNAACLFLNDQSAVDRWYKLGTKRILTTVCGATWRVTDFETSGAQFDASFCSAQFGSHRDMLNIENS